MDANSAYTEQQREGAARLWSEKMWYVERMATGLQDPRVEKKKLAKMYAQLYPDYATDHTIQSIGPNSFQPNSNASILDLFSSKEAAQYVGNLFALTIEKVFKISPSKDDPLKIWKIDMDRDNTIAVLNSVSIDQNLIGIIMDAHSDKEGSLFNEISALSSGLLCVADLCTALTPTSDGSDTTNWTLSVNADALEMAMLHTLRHLGFLQGKSSMIGKLKLQRVDQRSFSSLAREYVSHNLPLEQWNAKWVDMLIEAVGKHGKEMVKGQLKLATVAAIALVLDLKKNPRKPALAKNIAFLCLFTAIQSAFDMSRLCNPNFFHLLNTTDRGMWKVIRN